VFIFSFTKAALSPLSHEGSFKHFLYFNIHSNHLSNTVIALWVLYFSITPTDQSIDFPRLYLIVNFLTHWRRFNRWSFKPSLTFVIFFKSIRTFTFVNQLLKFLFHHLMNYLLRSLFNYFTTHPKNVNPENKKTVTFFW
jgi:hypothetical protein